MSSFMNINRFATDKMLKRFEHIRHSNSLRRVAFFIALAIFIIGLITSFLSVPDIATRIKIVPFLIVIFIGVPLTLILNAFDVLLTGHLIKKEFQFFDALRISIFGSAANMLPLPGGAVVRIAALKGKGAALGDSTRATFATGIIWLGVSLLYSGLWMLPFASMLGGLTVLAGCGILAVGTAMGLKTYSKNKTIIKIIGLKVVATLLITIKLIFCVAAIGTHITFTEAGVMTAADVIGSAVMIVPGGLGVNEGMTALLAQIVGLTAATGFLAAVTNRLATLLALCPITLFLYFKTQDNDTNNAGA